MDGVSAHKLKMWGESLLLAVAIFLALLLYVYFYNDGLTPLAWSQAVAGAAGFMIGLSFAMSGIGYWWDFLDKKVANRKYYGLVGYYLALAYSLMLPFLFPQRYWDGFFENFFSPHIFLGVLAMVMLTMMAVISNNQAMQKLGPQRWRQLLRLGYLAYALLILRAVLVEWQWWEPWLHGPDGLPPPRLTLSVFAAAVILLRASVYMSKKSRQQTATDAQSDTTE